MFKPKEVKSYLLSGVSYAVPVVACGGILIAISTAFVPMTPAGPDYSASPFFKMLNDIGAAAFSMLVPVLAAYVAFGMADRPGIAPGLVAGVLANQIGAGFLGGLVGGLLAGTVVAYMKKIKLPIYLRPVMPILIIPTVSSIIVGLVMLNVVGYPIKGLMDALTAWLQSIGTGNMLALAAVLGAMIAFDMGGPVNKVAFFFGAAMIKEGNYAVMGACAAAICIPPLGLGLATIIGRRLWTEQEREAGYAGLAMGMVGITEGAIPFAAGDPLRVIPTIMLGSAIGAVVAALGKVGDHAPHGGPIVIPVIDNRLVYVAAIAIGSVVVALVINALKRWTGGEAVRSAGP